MRCVSQILISQTLALFENFLDSHYYEVHGLVFEVIKYTPCGVAQLSIWFLFCLTSDVMSVLLSWVGFIAVQAFLCFLEVHVFPLVLFQGSSSNGSIVTVELLRFQPCILIASIQLLSMCIQFLCWGWLASQGQTIFPRNQSIAPQHYTQKYIFTIQDQ